MKFRVLNIYFYVLFLLCHGLETNSSRTTLWTALKECLNSRLKRGIRMCKYERVCGLWETEKSNMAKAWNVNIGVIRYDTGKASRRLKTILRRISMNGF